MKIAVKILKAVILLLTAVWGIIFGIFAPISIMQNEELNSPILIIWLLNSVLCYIPGTVLLMLGLHKIASGFHSAGMIAAIVIYSVMQRQYPDSNSAVLYMPVIFISLLTAIVALITNYQQLSETLAEKEKKKYAPAPSILGGMTQASPQTDDSKKSNKKSQKR